MKYLSVRSSWRSKCASLLGAALLTAFTCIAGAEEYRITEASQLQSTFSRLVPGDTVIIEGGDYRPGVVNAPYNHLLIRDKNGSSNAWITIRNRAGTRPRIFLGGTTTGLTILNSSYIRIEGLELVGTPDNVETFGISASGHHLQIVDNVVHGFRGNCISPGGSQLLVEGNVVYDCAKTERPWGASGISIYQPEMRSSNNADFAGALGNPNNAYSIIIRNNVVRDVHQRNPVQGTNDLSDGNGIILDDFNQTQRPAGQRTPFTGRTLVANNLLYDNGGHGIHLFHSEHIDVFHNTLYQNSKDLSLSRALDGELSNWGADNHFHNNIVYTRPGTKASVTNGSPNTTWSNNLYFGDRGHVQGADDLVNVDPRFTSPGLTPSADFSLRNSSPAIGRGKGGLGIELDMEGRERPSRPAIGALEADSPSPTPLPSSTPTVRPTATLRPTSTPTPRPTSTPLATASATATPRSTSTPVATATPRSTSTPVATATPRPTMVPSTPTPTRTPQPMATSNGESQSVKTQAIPRVRGVVPRIDGVVSRDKGWSAARTVQLRNVITGSTRSTASVKVAYNEQSLFVAFLVKDRNGIAAATSDWWMNDGVEIFIDKDNSKSETYGVGDLQLFLGIEENKLRTIQGALSGTVAFARRVTRSGYLVEVEIPWSALGISPTERTTFGIDFALTDRVGTGRAKLAWNAKVDDLWLSPRLFGTARLK